MGDDNILPQSPLDFTVKILHSETKERVGTGIVISPDGQMMAFIERVPGAMQV